MGHAGRKSSPGRTQNINFAISKKQPLFEFLVPVISSLRYGTVYFVCLFRASSSCHGVLREGDDGLRVRGAKDDIRRRDDEFPDTSSPAQEPGAGEQVNLTFLQDS